MNEINLIDPEDLKHSLQKDELIKRLKKLCDDLKDVPQHLDYSDLVFPIAVHLATPFFLKHVNKDVKLLVACALSDILRIVAPQLPFKDEATLRSMFQFFIKQLKGLEDISHPSSKRYFYLLENLSIVRTFNVMVELPNSNALVCKLFTVCFDAICNFSSEKHTSKVRSNMLDMLFPLLKEYDEIPSDILDAIYLWILEPNKSKSPAAYQLAGDILKKSACIIEPYVMQLFNDLLLMGKEVSSKVAPNVYDLLYEIHRVAPTTLLFVLPQLEINLKSSNEKERNSTVSSLGKMFSDEGSQLHSENSNLWHCFLGRFFDAQLSVRLQCVKFLTNFVLYHFDDLGEDLVPVIQKSALDPEESVRRAVCMSIAEIAKFGTFRDVKPSLLEILKERLRDKKWSVRKEAATTLAALFKKFNSDEMAPQSFKESISWISSTLLHIYYYNNVDDRFLIEILLWTTIIPVSNTLKERMETLMKIYCNVDERASRVIQEIFKMQAHTRLHLKGLLNCVKSKTKDDVSQKIGHHLTSLARHCMDPIRNKDAIRRFYFYLDEDDELQADLVKILSDDISVKEATELATSLHSKLASSKSLHGSIDVVKLIIDRITPLLFDHDSIHYLMTIISNFIQCDTCEVLAGSPDISYSDMSSCLKDTSGGFARGLELLKVISAYFPHTFLQENVISCACELLHQNQSTLPILKILAALEINERLCPTLQSTCEDLVFSTSDPSVAKYAVKCIHRLGNDLSPIVNGCMNVFKTPSSQQTHGALAALTQVAFYCPDEYSTTLKTLVTKYVVKELLMSSTFKGNPCASDWCSKEELSSNIRLRIRGMKLITMWLLGMKDGKAKIASSTLRLLHTIVMNKGDLMEENVLNKAEMAHLRLAAGKNFISLCKELCYYSILEFHHFQTMAELILDPCIEVRRGFCIKLNKELTSLRLPLEFLSIFCLIGMEKNSSLFTAHREMLLRNIVIRRDLLKQSQMSSSEKLAAVMPDYVVPYCVHLLANRIESLTNEHELFSIKKCLSILLEAILHEDGSNFSFLRSTFQAIKTTEDNQAPQDKNRNEILYAVCDIAISVLITKNIGVVSNDFPVKPRLPLKHFKQKEVITPNHKIYAPTIVLDSSVEIEENTSKLNNKRSAKMSKSKENLLTLSVNSTVENSPAIKVQTNLSGFAKHSEKPRKRPSNSSLSPNRKTPRVSFLGTDSSKENSPNEDLSLVIGKYDYEGPPPPDVEINNSQSSATNTSLSVGSPAKTITKPKSILKTTMVKSKYKQVHVKPKQATSKRLAKAALRHSQEIALKSTKKIRQKSTSKSPFKNEVSGKSPLRKSGSSKSPSRKDVNIKLDSKNEGTSKSPSVKEVNNKPASRKSFTLKSPSRKEISAKSSSKTEVKQKVSSRKEVSTKSPSIKEVSSKSKKEVKTKIESNIKSTSKSKANGKSPSRKMPMTRSQANIELIKSPRQIKSPKQVNNIKSPRGKSAKRTRDIVKTGSIRLRSKTSISPVMSTRSSLRLTPRSSPKKIQSRAKSASPKRSDSPVY